MTEPGTNARGTGFGRYLKEAFLFRWNLLFFLAGLAGALLSPFPDALLPLLGAAELTYLVGLTSIPRFRAAVDAKAHSQRIGADGAVVPQQTLAELWRELDEGRRERFERLRERCLDMQKLASGVRGQTDDAGRASEIQTPALDRMLWAFLRLLYSQQALERFLSSTDDSALEQQLAALETRQAKARERKDERILKSLSDSIVTTRLRLENYQKAASNAEFVSVELDRIEGKIQALTEMGVGHQEAGSLSVQADTVAESMAHTEAAIRELNQITGLGEQLSEPPPLLNADLERGS